MTDQPSITLRLDALKPVPRTVGDVPPTLVIRCDEERLQVYVATGSVLSSSTYDLTHVRLRWGTGTPEEDAWSRSTDLTAAFAREARPFLARLVASPDLRFEFQPFDAAPLVASFDARGLERYVSDLEAACPPPPQREEGSSVGQQVLGEGQVFMEAIVEERASILSAHKLHYPDLLKQAGIQGRVIVQVIVDTMGRAERNSVKILQSPNPGFDESATRYVLKAMFRPARVHGRAVRVLMQVPVEFKIKGS